MDFVITLIGVLQVLVGVAVFLGVGVNVVHEILGAIIFGFGVLAIALGNILTQLVRIRKASEPTGKFFSERAKQP